MLRAWPAGLRVSRGRGGLPGQGWQHLCRTGSCLWLEWHESKSVQNRGGRDHFGVGSLLQAEPLPKGERGWEGGGGPGLQCLEKEAWSRYPQLLPLLWQPGAPADSSSGRGEGSRAPLGISPAVTGLMAHAVHGECAVGTRGGCSSLGHCSRLLLRSPARRPASRPAGNCVCFSLGQAHTRWEPTAWKVEPWLGKQEGTSLKHEPAASGQRPAGNQPRGPSARSALRGGRTPHHPACWAAAVTLFQAWSSGSEHPGGRRRAAMAMQVCHRLRHENQQNGSSQPG